MENDRSRKIKTMAMELGFYACGIARADHLVEEEDRLKRWLEEKQHAGMAYMENHFDKRLDPRLLVDGAKSVISVLLNYYPAKTQQHTVIPCRFRYACHACTGHQDPDPGDKHATHPTGRGFNANTDMLQGTYQDITQCKGEA